MERNKLGRAALVGGLALAVTGGCAGKGNLGMIGLAKNLAKFGEIALYEPTHSDIEGITFSRSIYVGSERDLLHEAGNGFPAARCNGKDYVNYTDDFVIAVDTRNHAGSTLTFTFLAIDPASTKGKKHPADFRNSVQMVGKYEHVVGADEPYVLWKPFVNGDNLDRKFSVQCDYISRDGLHEGALGSWSWQFKHHPKNFYESGEKEIVQK